jgi:hypothetical protein
LEFLENLAASTSSTDVPDDEICGAKKPSHFDQKKLCKKMNSLAFCQQFTKSKIVEHLWIREVIIYQTGKC